MADTDYTCVVGWRDDAERQFIRTSRTAIYELDVVFKPPGPAFVSDEDEFIAAAVEHGYSEEFKRACYQTVREALGVANQWQANGMPIFTGS